MKQIKDELIALGYGNAEFMRCDGEVHNYGVVLLVADEFRLLCPAAGTRLVLYKAESGEVGYRSTALFFYMNVVGI